MAKSQGEKGQAVPILVVALSLVLVGGMGLAIDASNLYQQTQKAQVAADAAATAAALSIYQGVNLVSANPAKFSLSPGGSITCTTADAELPCAYARLNGFGGTGADTVVVDAPVCGGTPDPCAGIANLASAYTPSLVRVTVSRNTHNSIMRMLGAADTSLIRAVGIAGILDVTTPVPIIVTHPSLDHSFNTTGTVTLQVCGGPSQSIQVNSTNGSAFSPAQGTVDLRYAGPNGSQDGSCTILAGADFGVTGGVSTMPPEVLPGSGHYRSPHSWIPDPFKDVDPPDPSKLPQANVVPPPTHVFSPNGGCVQAAGCWLFSPGVYSDSLPWLPPGYNWSPLNINKLGYNNVLFKPGVYYVEHNQRNPADTGVDFTGVQGGGDKYSILCNDTTLCPVQPAATPLSPTAQGTGSGVLFYDTSANGSILGNNPTGGFNVGTGANIVVTGPTITTIDPTSGKPVPAPPYYDIAFWEDRTADVHPTNQPHVIGTGNGCFTMQGATIYITNTREIMTANPAHYQAVKYAGTPCSSTFNTGDIIVSTFEVNGNSVIRMQLIPFAWVHTYKVALVGGGPHP